jgi:hypothetical protein
VGRSGNKPSDGRASIRCPYPRPFDWREIGGQIGGFSVELSPIACAIDVVQSRDVRLTRSSLAPDQDYALEDPVLHFLSSFFVPSDLSGVRDGGVRYG